MCVRACVYVGGGGATCINMRYTPPMHIHDTYIHIIRVILETHNNGQQTAEHDANNNICIYEPATGIILYYYCTREVYIRTGGTCACTIDMYTLVTVVYRRACVRACEGSSSMCESGIKREERTEWKKKAEKRRREHPARARTHTHQLGRIDM